MIWFFLWSALLTAAAQEVSVKVTAPGDGSFSGWSLKLDTDVQVDLSQNGVVSLSIPEDSISFEILDDEEVVRFFGLWSQYANQTDITIHVAGEGLNLHQVVSASRIQQSSWEVPGEIEVLKPVDQVERGAAQTSDWLKESSGVLLQKTNLGGGSPIIRGVSGNRVLLMVDGFRLNNAIFRLGLNQYLNTVPASQLEQIEVLSGPTGVQYGSDGLGGTVHMRSADPASLEESNLGYTGFVSTADGTNTHLLQAHTNVGNLFIQGHYKNYKYENLEAGDPLGEQIATGFDSWDASLNLTYKLNEGQRLRLLNNNSDARNVPRTDRIISGRDLLWEYDPQKWRLHGLRFESERKSRFLDFMDIGFGYMRQDEGTNRISSGRPDRLTSDFISVDTLQFNGTFTKVTDRVQWVYGFDSQLDRLDGEAFQFFDDGTVNSIGGKFPNDSEYRSSGLFGTADIELANRQRFKVGLRQAWFNLKGTLAEPIGFVDQSFNQLTPSLTWSYDHQDVFVSLGASQGFRAPNIEDSLALGPSNSGFDAPNPNLQPEELWSYEINMRYRRATNLFQATVYHGDYDGLIDRVPGVWQGSDTFDGEPVFILDNVDKAEINGASIQGEHLLSDMHSLQWDGSWTRGETDGGEPMRRIAPLRGNVVWRMRAEKWRVSSIFSWADRQDRLSNGDINDSRIPEGGTPGYGVFHVRGYYEFSKQFSLNIGAENLTDKLYKAHGSGVYEAGRRVVIEVNASWK